VNTRSVIAHNNTINLDEINVMAAEYNFRGWLFDPRPLSELP